MADGAKKISFGFAKSIKKPVLQNAPAQEKKVDYIECLDQKSIKVIGEEEKSDEPLIIPMLGSRTWHDRIINKIDADIFEPKIVPTLNDTEATIKQEPIDVPNGTSEISSASEKKVGIKEEPKEESNVPATLDEQAAKEIIQELKSQDAEPNKLDTLTLPITENQSLRGQDESSLQDYEQIPVDAFGMAMLRGMGWQPGMGLGKSGKIATAVIPELRPKGMGLGADRVTAKKPTTNTKGKQEEELKLEKGSFVKIIAGKQNNNYGQIEGFDDDAGRLIVKLALGGGIVSLNEFMVQPVTSSEYAKNSKVLNTSKYEKYKNKEANDGIVISSESSDDDDNETARPSKHRKDEERRKRSKEESKSKKHKRRESDSDGEVERKSRKRRSPSDSDAYKPKKSKKHKKHDSSPERSTKKHKKRDKERERSKDRRKNKKHKRSRSRSPKKR